MSKHLDGAIALIGRTLPCDDNEAHDAWDKIQQELAAATTLATFGRSVLLILEEAKDWSSDTLDEIAMRAMNDGLADLVSEYFTPLLPKEIDA